MALNFAMLKAPFLGKLQSAPRPTFAQAKSQTASNGRSSPTSQAVSTAGTHVYVPPSETACWNYLRPQRLLSLGVLLAFNILSIGLLIATGIIVNNQQSKVEKARQQVPGLKVESGEVVSDAMGLAVVEVAEVLASAVSIILIYAHYPNPETKTTFIMRTVIFVALAVLQLVTVLFASIITFSKSAKVHAQIDQQSVQFENAIGIFGIKTKYRDFPTLVAYVVISWFGFFAMVFATIYVLLASHYSKSAQSDYLDGSERYTTHMVDMEGTPLYTNDASSKAALAYSLNDDNYRDDGYDGNLGLGGGGGGGKGLFADDRSLRGGRGRSMFVESGLLDSDDGYLKHPSELSERDRERDRALSALSGHRNPKEQEKERDDLMAYFEREKRKEEGDYDSDEDEDEDDEATAFDTRPVGLNTRGSTGSNRVKGPRAQSGDEKVDEGK